jgi:hypothetical protein
MMIEDEHGRLRPDDSNKWQCHTHGGLYPYAENCPQCEADEVAARKTFLEGTAAQKTGGSVDYYKCHVADPIDPNNPPYTAESIDIIEALGMTFAEGEAFKAIWRTCTGRMGGAVKADNKALYNAEKVEFFGARMVRAAKRSEE